MTQALQNCNAPLQVLQELTKCRKKPHSAAHVCHSLSQLKSSFKQLTDSGSGSVGVKGRVQQEMHGGDERENQNMQLLHSLLSSHSRFIHGALRWGWRFAVGVPCSVLCSLCDLQILH